MTEPSESHRRRIREGFWVTLLAIFSKLAGLARELLLAGLFGTTAAADAFRVAWNGFSLPLQVLSGSPLENTVVPQLRGLIAGDDERAAQACASVILLALTAAGALLLALVALKARALVGLLAPGFDAERADLCASLLRWLALLLPVALAGRLLVVLSYARDHFRIAALRPLLINLALLTGTVAAARSGDLRWFAWLPALAWVGHLLLLGRDLRGIWVWRPRLAEAGAALKRLGWLFPLALAASLGDQGFALADQIVASTLGGGRVAAFEYARFVVETPLATAGTGLVVVALPLLAEWVALGKLREIHAGAERVLAPALLLLLPIGLLFCLGASPLVTLIFSRGAFGGGAHGETVAALMGLSLGLWAHFAAYFLFRLYYAGGAFATLALQMTAALALNVALNVLLAPRWGLWGIAIATSISRVLLMVLTAGALPAALRRRLGLRLLHLLLGAAVFAGLAARLHWAPLPVPPSASAALQSDPSASILMLARLAGALLLFWAAWTLPLPYWRQTCRELMNLLCRKSRG
jgi:putative peptidoglycan lipid II flippase